MHMQEKSDRPRWEVADVFRRFGASYAAERPMPSFHTRVMRHILDCRTAALGGHVERCGDCGLERPVYNSCRDRHCPKCQTMAKERWVEARKAELLPVEYFHKVFTLPHELNGLALVNKRVVLGILFKAVAETLLSFGKDSRSRLGGKVGFTLVLHTWNQQLLDHFHLHCVIPAGGLSEDGRTWIKSRSGGFLFSVKALGIVFRGKFLDALARAYDQEDLIFPGAISDLSNPQLFATLVESLRSKEWVVYSKAPFGGPERVLEYLGRYTHRVAIANHRLVDVADEGVRFSYRDRADDNKTKVAAVSGHEFIRRFLLHALPRGFVRIRHYGFLASRNKQDMLMHCRQALAVRTLEITPRKSAEEMLLQRGIDLRCCPRCITGRMRKDHELLVDAALHRRRISTAAINTS